jgi:hypothetical protein
MNYIKHHVPDFARDGRDPIITEAFLTTADLLALEKVSRWKDSDFSHFAMNKNHLMAILHNGFQWWVVGYIEDPTVIDLPQWDHGKYRVQYEDGTINEVAGTEVRMSSGDDVWLTNGVKAKRIRPTR